MTNEEKRIKIAECCGWTQLQRDNPSEFGGLKGDHPTKGIRCIPPYFPRDLNAMAEAESFLNSEEFEQYGKLLCEAAMVFTSDDSRNRAMVSASAETRANAFLKAKGIL